MQKGNYHPKRIHDLLDIQVVTEEDGAWVSERILKPFGKRILEPPYLITKCEMQRTVLLAQLIGHVTLKMTRESQNSIFFS